MIHGGFSGKSTNSCVSCSDCLTSHSWQVKSSDSAGWNKSVSMSSFSHSIQVLFSKCLIIHRVSTAAVCAVRALCGEAFCYLLWEHS